MRSQLKSLTRDTMIYGLGQAVGRMLTKVALVPLLTRAFVPAQFGAWDLITTLLAILQVLFISGLDGGLSRYLYEEQTEEERRRLVSTALAWRLLLSAAVCVPASLLAGQVARHVYGDPTLLPYLRVALLSVPCTLAVMFVSDYLRLTFRPWAFIAFTVLDSLAYAVLVFWLVWIRHSGVTGALGAQLVADLCFALAGLILVRRSLTLKWSAARLRDLLQVGLPFVPVALSYWVIQYADRNFLMRYRGYQELGIYGAAAKVALIMTFVVQAFTLAWGPFAFSQARAEVGRKLFARVLGLYAWGGGALAVFLSVFAREILAVGTTRAYVGGHPVASLLVFSSLLNGAYYIFIIGISMARKTSIVAFILLASAALTVGLNFLWAGPYGMYGVGVATLAGYVSATVLLAAASQRVFPCPYPLGRSALVLIWAGMLAAAGASLPAWGLAERIAIKLGLCALYLGTSFLFRLVSWNDVRTVGAMVALRLRGPRPREA